MKVIIYTTQYCHWCALAKEFFKENKVKYTEVDVGSNKKGAQEMIKKSGQMGVPVIDIDGKIIIGFDEAELRKTLKLK